MASGEVAAGFVCAFISMIFLSTNFIPVKRYDMKDGIAYLWMMGTGIWLTGLIVNIILGSAEFSALGVFGGIILSLGTILIVPIARTIGLGMGILMWSSVHNIWGWCIGYFGMFGLNPNDTIAKPIYNYVGFAFAFIALFLYSLLRTNVEAPSNKNDDEVKMEVIVEKVNHMGNGVELNGTQIEFAGKLEDVGRDPGSDTRSDSSFDAVKDGQLQNDGSDVFYFLDELSPHHKKLVGCLMAIVAGFLFAVAFVPAQYSIDNQWGSPKTIDYVFSHCCGIGLASTGWMMVYIVCTKNNPYLNTRAIIPSIVSGVMWAIGITTWFIANGILQFVITMPVIIIGINFMSLIIGILFNEISGRRNYIILLAALSCIGVSVALIAYSAVP